jgi:AcrR family transcriptional regulator
VTESSAPPSARKTELLEAAYRYALEHGTGDLSLRPLAAAVGSSPRVLLYLFGSKEGLIRALLARARADEVSSLAALPPAPGLEAAGLAVWAWLIAPDRRALLTFWVEAYARSVVDPAGPWSGFARATVEDWLTILERAQPPDHRDDVEARAERTAVLAVLRGALLDLLATGDTERTTAAVRRLLA